MGKIILDNMEFFAYHGCFKEEQIIGNRFLVHLEMELDTRQAEESDRLHDTVNYQSVYQVIARQMKEKSHLLEHIAGRIISAVMAEFTVIKRIQVRISKMNPPLGGKMGCVSVEIEKIRSH